jgi:hypothetical protein
MASAGGDVGLFMGPDLPVPLLELPDLGLLLGIEVWSYQALAGGLSFFLGLILWGCLGLVLFFS